MSCPDCGYMMTAFDKSCPRCEKLGKPQKPCLKCGTASEIKAKACFHCGHRFGEPLESIKPEAAPVKPTDSLHGFFPSAIPSATSTVTSSVTSSKPTVPAPPPAQSSVLPADYLLCRVCANNAVQKVSVICENGTWTEQSQGHTVGVAYGPNGMLPMQGVTNAKVSGATTLAQMLMPPPRPFYGGNGCMVPAGSIMAILGLAFSVICLGGTENMAGVVIWLIVFGVGVALVLLARSNDWNGKKRIAEQFPRWQKAMTTWNRLFYCPRCGHVFDPSGGAFVPANQIRQLL